MSKSTRWIFTLNNWTSDEKDRLLAWASQSGKYMVIGEEKGKQETPHLQGYVVLKKESRLSAMKKVNERIHWEIARGTTEEASEYCKKDGNFQEVGVMPSRKRAGETEQNRWDAAKEAAKEGRFDDIPSDIYFRYYRTCKEIKKDHMPKCADADDVTGVWIYGPPGYGKSRKAREDYPDSYNKMQNKWWDGYQDEESVILDDLDSKELGHLLKIWMDRYAFIAETKGGAIQIRPKKFIVTSNYSIESLFQHDQVLAEAIKRRCEVIYLDKPAFDDIKINSHIPVTTF